MKEPLLTEAANAYAVDHIPEFTSPSYLATAISLAFMEGALWYNQVMIDRAQTQLNAVNQKIAELQESK